VPFIPENAEESRHLRSLLQFFAYDVVVADQEFLDGTQNRDWLASWGFQIARPIAMTELQLIHDTNETTMDGGWTDDSIAPMVSYYEALSEHRNTGTTTTTTSKDNDDDDSYSWGDFDMDGCVHKLSQASLKEALGRSMKSPKWAVAHKFPPLAAVTNLLDVIVQVGRTGALTPVAVLEPVEVGGVTIQRASLHNFVHLKQILANDNSTNNNNRIPVGTPVLVRRAGDVIPQVVQRIDSNGDNQESKTATNEKNNNDTSSTSISLEPPTTCPACGSPVVWEEPSSKSKNSTVGQIVRCGGSPLLCPPRAITSLAHAYSRDAMDVTGLSEARIQQLMDAGLLRFPCDVFQWSDDAEWNTIAEEIPGWGPKSCQNLKASIQRVASNGSQGNSRIATIAKSGGRNQGRRGLAGLARYSFAFLVPGYDSLPQQSNYS
jgi:NAD-dependent DNA ligase